MKIKLNFKSFIMFFLFFGLIYINCSLWAVDGITGTVQFVIKIILVLFVIFVGKLKFHRENALLFLVLLILMIITIATSGFYFDLDMGAILNLILAFVFISCIDEELFHRYYCSIMYFFSVCSIIGFILYYIGKPILSFAPKFSGHYGIEFSNLIVTLVPLNMNDYFRNWSIFREPGYYAVFLVFTLLFELFFLKQKRFKVIIIESIALILTFSTTGILGLFLLMLATLYTHGINKADRKWKKQIIVASVVLCMMTIFWFIFTESGLQMFSRVFGKIFIDSESNVSYLNRAIGMRHSLIIFGNNVITGGGYISFLNTEVDCTQLQWFAIYGLVFGLICNFLYLTYAFKIRENKLCKLLIAAAMFIVAYGQPIETSMITFILLYYSLYHFSAKNNYIKKVII